MREAPFKHNSRRLTPCVRTSEQLTHPDTRMKRQAKGRSSSGVDAVGDEENWLVVRW